jgi:hypothetical protein
MGNIAAKALRKLLYDILIIQNRATECHKTGVLA